MKWLWQIYIILFFLFIQFIIAGFSSCFIDLTEANTAALLLTPGTISLLFFCCHLKIYVGYIGYVQRLHQWYLPLRLITGIW